MDPFKPYLYAAIGLAVIGGLVWFVQHQRSIGGEAERAKQERANAEFTVKANKGIVDFDTCDRAGGLFDFRKGACQLGRP